MILRNMRIYIIVTGKTGVLREFVVKIHTKNPKARVNKKTFKNMIWDNGPPKTTIRDDSLRESPGALSSQAMTLAVKLLRGIWYQTQSSMQRQFPLGIAGFEVSQNDTSRLEVALKRFEIIRNLQGEVAERLCARLQIVSMGVRISPSPLLFRVIYKQWILPYV